MHDLELDLYERDFPCWAERQAELLRRGLADQADLARIAEELEALGSEQRNKVHSHLAQALAHILKVYGWPGSIYAEKWRAEVELHRMKARLRYTPSMRQRLDPERIYRDARSMVPATMDGLAPIGEIPARCPFTLDELLSEAVLDLSANTKPRTP